MGQSSAVAFLYLIGVGFAATLMYQVITKQPIDSTILGLLYGILGFAINSQGVKTGVDTTNATVEKAAVATAVLAAKVPPAPPSNAP